MQVRNEMHITLRSDDLKLGAVNGGLRQELAPGTGTVVIHAEADTRYQQLALKARKALEVYAAGHHLLDAENPGPMAGAHAMAVAQAMEELEEELGR